MKTDQKPVTIKQAAELLGISEITLYRHIATIPHVRIGKRILISPFFVKQALGQPAGADSEAQR